MAHVLGNFFWRNPLDELLNDAGLDLRIYQVIRSRDELAPAAGIEAAIFLPTGPGALSMFYETGSMTGRTLQLGRHFISGRSHRYEPFDFQISD